MYGNRPGSFGTTLFASLLALLFVLSGSALAAGMMTSKPFMGAKANTGTVSMHKEGGKMMLTLSDDFKVPDTPDPHWQVVDSKGNVYLLQRLMIKDDKLNKTITLPAYVMDVAKVQIWCAWAETNLGEAPFEKMMK
jgi:hypothetical protein